MAFKKVTNNATDIKDHEGVPFIGKYQGHKEIETKLGEQVIWQFIDPQGVPFEMYGFTNLNRNMQSIPEGSLCRITYRGKKNMQTKYGMKDVHQVDVEVDDQTAVA